MKPSPQPPQRVPVLTEVVDLPQATPEVVEEYPPMPQDPAYADTAPAGLDDWPPPVGAGPGRPLDPAPTGLDISLGQPRLFDEGALTQRVLADLERQIDLMFEHRLREAIAPVLARTTDTLVREMRNQLATSLREMVARAVSLEIERINRR
jgi:hypothetical protein